MRGQNLKFNTDDLEKANRELSQIARDVRQAKSGLMASFSALKTVYWQSMAGDAFLAGYEDGWSQNVDQYLGYLEHFAQMLSVARSEYEAISQKARNLTI